MSALYGTIGGDGRAQARNRCTHHQTWAAARSWEGSVTVTVERRLDSTLCAKIYVDEGSNTGGRILWSGTLAELLSAAELRIVKRGRKAA